MRNIFKTLLLPFAALVIGIIGTVSIHTAVAGPSAAPPYNNVSSPVNTGAIAQVKKGLLGLGDLQTQVLGGYQLFVKGKTRLQGRTDIVGATRVEGILTVTQDAHAKGFCLPADGGGCVSKWATQWEAVPGMSNINCLNQTTSKCSININVPAFDVSYEYRIVASSVEGTSKKYFSCDNVGNYSLICDSFTGYYTLSGGQPMVKPLYESIGVAVTSGESPNRFEVSWSTHDFTNTIPAGVGMDKYNYGSLTVYRKK